MYNQLNNTNDDNHPFLNERDDIPELTQWRNIGSFLCLPIAGIDNTNRRYCLYWEINFYMPVIVIFMMIITYSIFIIKTIIVVLRKLHMITPVPQKSEKVN